MAEGTTDNPENAPAGEVAAAPEPRWSELWQVPVLVLGIVMLAGWWVMTVRSNDKVNDYNGAITSAQEFLKANDAESAFGVLNDKLLPFAKAATPQDQARIKQLEADTQFLHVKLAGINQEEQWKAIDTLYTEARTLGLEFDAEHLQRWAQVLVSLNRAQDALALLEPLGDSGASSRYALLRAIIEQQRQAGTSGDQLITLISRFQDEIKREPDAASRRAQEIWVTRLLAQLSAEAGDTARAIDYLNQRISRLAADGGDGDLGPLLVTLAEAYETSGNPAMARRLFAQAQQKLAPDHSLNADILIGIGRLDLSEGNDVRSALGNFTDAMTRFPTDIPAQLKALVGRANCEARLGTHGDAVEHFKAAIQIATSRPHRDIKMEDTLIEAVRGHFDSSIDRGQFAVALEYLQALPPLYAGNQEWPARLLLDFATTLDRLADADFAEGLGLNKAAPVATDGSSLLAAPLSGKADDASPVTPAQQLAFQRAAGRFEQAAGYYLRHAHAVANTDEIAYGLSLWRAAAAYDRAQLWGKAIEVYGEFVLNRPGDPRLLMARLQLGQAYEADRQFEAALGQFKNIQTKQPRSPEAYASLVPMARCYIALKNNDDAERILRHVTTNHPSITPDSEAYRQAIIELSNLYYRTDRFADAIPPLSFAVERYSTMREAPMIRFRLADAYRRSVDEIARAMEDPMPQSRRVALEAERTRRLEEAVGLYTGVISELEGPRQQTLTPLEALCFRNAFFYRADCAYDLRRFEQAIQLYEIAARRWENHPSALVALVQIVNANAELGRVQDARVATRKAQALLKRIPEDRFNDETVPMSRKHWEEWLRWTSELNLFDAAGSTSAGAAVQADAP